MNDRLVSTHVDTAVHPAADQFELWRHAVVGFDVTRPDADQGTPFRAKVDAWSLGDIAVVSNEFDAAQRFVPSTSPAQPQNYSLVLVLEGTVDLAIGDERQTAAQGQIVVFDWRRAVIADLSPVRILIVVMPHRRLRAEMGRVPDLHGVQVGGLAGRLLTDYLTLLLRELRAAGPDDGPMLASATTKVIAACLSTVPAAARPADAALGSAVRHRVERHVEERLGQRALSVDSVARDLSISRASLYRAFAPVGGLSNHILTRRLEAAHAALDDRDDGRTIKGISTAFGFASAANFHNAFRARFGYRPSQVRSGLIGAGLAAALDPLASPEEKLRALIARLSR